MMINQAYTVLMTLCSGEPQMMPGYEAHLGKFNPDKVDFQMIEDYQEIKSKEVKAGIADTTWIDEVEKVMILKSDLDWKVELRKYTDPEMFKLHVDIIREKGVN